MDKMREEFELAWKIKGMDDEGNLGGKPTRSKIYGDRYAGDAAQFAWSWWKRSRESLCVELPCESSIWWHQDVCESLEEAGVSYK